MHGWKTNRLIRVGRLESIASPRCSLMGGARTCHATGPPGARARRPRGVIAHASTSIAPTGPPAAHARIRATPRPTRRGATASDRADGLQEPFRTRLSTSRHVRWDRLTLQERAGPGTRLALATDARGTGCSGRRSHRRRPTDASGVRSRAGTDRRPRMQRLQRRSRATPRAFGRRDIWGECESSLARRCVR